MTPILLLRTKGILSECVTFYENLYTSTKWDYSQSAFFQQKHQTVLSHEEQRICEGPVTQNECANALKDVDSDKTPGAYPQNSIKFFGKISPRF